MTLSPASFIKRLQRNFLLEIAFALLVTFLFGCKKEKVVQVDCSFSAPASGTTFSYNDTLLVTVDIQSNYTIERVDVQIASNSGSVSLPLQTSFPGIYSTVLNFTIPLSDMYMESGTYFIQAIISSNGVASRFNRNFTYSGLVKQVSGLLFLSTNSPLQLNINQLDFLTPVLLSTITSDYLGSSISSKAKLLNISGQTSGLTGIDLNDYSTLFHYQPVGTGTLSSTAYSFDKEVNYLACSDGNIQGINELGHREFQTGANQFLSIHHVLKGNDFVLADFYKSATMETKIGSFFYPSGDARNELSIDFDVVSLLPIDAQNVRVFGNRNQHGLIYDYSIPDNTLTLKRDQNGIIFRSAISTQNSNLIFTDQGIWLYTDAQGAMNVSAIDAIGGSYEEVNNVVYCFSTHKIYELQGSSLMEMNQLSVADSVLAVHVLYNK